jgi:hypothetical protein
LEGGFAGGVGATATRGVRGTTARTGRGGEEETVDEADGVPFTLWPVSNRTRRLRLSIKMMAS